MRRILFVAFVTVAPYVQAQNITFEQIKGLRKKPINEVESFLSLEGWTFVRMSESTPNEMPKFYFGYKVNENNFKRAKSWLIYCQDDKTYYDNSVEFQVFSPELYTSFIKRAPINGFKLTKSYTDDGSIVKVYKADNTVLIVSVAPRSKTHNGSPLYKFIFVDSFRYEIFMKPSDK